MVLNIDAKFEVKLTFASKNDMRNLENFHQSTWMFQNLDFDGILLSEVENVWALRGELIVMTIKKDAQLEEELACCFKIDLTSLMSFDQSTQKSKNFSL